MDFVLLFYRRESDGEGTDTDRNGDIDLEHAVVPVGGARTIAETRRKRLESPRLVESDA